MLKAIKKKMKDQRGLTLVELLAVVVILGIISAIAFPSIGNIIEKSKEDAKVAEALQIINAAKLAHSSKSDIVKWNHTGTAPNGDSSKYGNLSDYLSNVEDNIYTVSYDKDTKLYSITDHNASSVITGNPTTVTEKALIDHTK